MISYISGQVIDEEQGVLTLLCRGLGYEIHCSSNTTTDIDDRKVVQLWIHTHVREDCLQLFGYNLQMYT